MGPAARTVSSSSFRSCGALPYAAASPRCRSSASKGHAFDADGGRVDAVAEFQVVGGHKMGEHILEVSRDSNFRDRKRDLAIFDPEAGRAAAVIAGHAIDSHAHQFGDIEALLYVGNKVFYGEFAGFQVEIGGRGRRRPAGALFHQSLPGSRQT